MAEGKWASKWEYMISHITKPNKAFINLRFVEEVHTLIMLPRKRLCKRNQASRDGDPAERSLLERFEELKRPSQADDPTVI